MLMLNVHGLVRAIHRGPYSFNIVVGHWSKNFRVFCGILLIEVGESFSGNSALSLGIALIRYDVLKNVFFMRRHRRRLLSHLRIGGTINNPRASLKRLQFTECTGRETKWANSCTKDEQIKGPSSYKSRAHAHSLEVCSFYSGRTAFPSKCSRIIPMSRLDKLMLQLSFIYLERMRPESLGCFNGKL